MQSCRQGLSACLRPARWLSIVGARALSIGASTCTSSMILYSVKLRLDFISIEQRNNHNPLSTTTPKPPSKWSSRGKPPASREFNRPSFHQCRIHDSSPIGGPQLCCGLLLTRRPATHSYNRYLAVASRVVRRSLKDEKRVAAERRGEMDLRFAKWEVS